MSDTQSKIARIEQIEKELAELKAEVKQELNSEPPLNVITQWPSEYNGGDGHINGRWAFALFETEREGCDYTGSRKSGHQASLYLDWANGTWYNEDGDVLKGYLYFKPKSDNNQ